MWKEAVFVWLLDVAAAKSKTSDSKGAQRGVKNLFGFQRHTILKSEFNTHAQQILLSPHVCITISHFLLFGGNERLGVAFRDHMMEAHGAVMWPDEGPWSADGSELSLDPDGSLPRTFTSWFTTIVWPKVENLFFLRNLSARLTQFPIQLCQSSSLTSYFTSGCKLGF